MSHLFISYKREDKKHLANLIEFLKQHDIPFWADLEIEAGLGWREEIDNALADAFAVAVIVTPNIFQSPYVTYEWSWAIGHEIPVIPLTFEATATNELHAKLNSIQAKSCINTIPDEVAEIIEEQRRQNRVARYVNHRILNGIIVPFMMLGMLTLFCDSPDLTEQEKYRLAGYTRHDFIRLNDTILPSIWLSTAHSFAPYQRKLFNNLGDKIDVVTKYLGKVDYISWAYKIGTPFAGFVPALRSHWLSIEGDYLFLVENSFPSYSKGQWQAVKDAHQNDAKKDLAEAIGVLITRMEHYAYGEVENSEDSLKGISLFMQMAQKVTGHTIGLG